MGYEGYKLGQFDTLTGKLEAYQQTKVLKGFALQLPFVSSVLLAAFLFIHAHVRVIPVIYP